MLTEISRERNLVACQRNGGPDKKPEESAGLRKLVEKSLSGIIRDLRSALTEFIESKEPRLPEIGFLPPPESKAVTDLSSAVTKAICDLEQFSFGPKSGSNDINEKVISNGLQGELRLFSLVLEHVSSRTDDLAASAVELLSSLGEVALQVEMLHKQQAQAA